MDSHSKVRSLTLPYVPPGSNQLHRLHHMEVARWRKQIRSDMAYLLLDEADAEPYKRAIITLDFRWKDRRRRDPGNGVEGMKAAVDALVGVWIEDDDACHVELRAKGKVGTGEPDHVIITVSEPER